MTEPTQPETEAATARRRLASKATRGRRDGAIWAFVAVMIFQTVVNYNLATTGENLINDEAAERRSAIATVESVLEQFEADRVDRSINACLDRNAIRIGVNRLALTGGGHDRDGNPTPGYLAATDDQRARLAPFLAELIPLQICTTEAIDLYVTSNRTQGVVPIDGSDGSYSEAVTAP